MFYHARQEVSALHTDCVRRQAEEDAYYAQQVDIVYHKSMLSTYYVMMKFLSSSYISPLYENVVR